MKFKMLIKKLIFYGKILKQTYLSIQTKNRTELILCTGITFKLFLAAFNSNATQ
jgi:hypothetical protein